MSMFRNGNAWSVSDPPATGSQKTGTPYRSKVVLVPMNVVR